MKKVYLVHMRLYGQRQFTGFPAVYGSVVRACSYASNLIEHTVIEEVEILPVVVD